MKFRRIPATLAALHFVGVLLVLWLSERAGNGNMGLYPFFFFDFPISLIITKSLDVIIPLDAQSTLVDFARWNNLFSAALAILGSAWVYIWSSLFCKLAEISSERSRR